MIIMVSTIWMLETARQLGTLRWWCNIVDQMVRRTTYTQCGQHSSGWDFQVTFITMSLHLLNSNDAPPSEVELLRQKKKNGPRSWSRDPRNSRFTFPFDSVLHRGPFTFFQQNLNKNLVYVWVNRELYWQLYSFWFAACRKCYRALKWNKSRKTIGAVSQQEEGVERWCGAFFLVSITIFIY